MRETVKNWIFKKRHVLTAVGLFVVLMLILSFFMGQTVSGAVDKGRSEYLYYTNENDTIEVGREGLVMRFEHMGPLYAIGLDIQSEEPVVGVLQLKLSSSEGEVLSIVTKDADEIRFGEITGFVFSQPIEAVDGILTLELTAETSASISVATGNSTPDGWQLYNDGQRVDGALIITGEVDRLGSFILVFYWGLAVFVSLAITGIYRLSKNRKMPLYKLYGVAVLLLGILFCFLLPPYSSPDEQFHINEAFTISSGWLGEIPESGVAWSENVMRADDNNAIIEDQNTTAFSYKEIFKNFFVASKDSTATVYKGDQVGGYKLLYWPAAMMVTLARLFGFGFVSTLFLGRMANLLLYALLTMLAVKYAPFKKSVFALVGLLPMSMHLAASFNRDALTIALYMFFTSYCLHLISGKEKIHVKDIVILLASALLAIPAKVIYAPLVLLVLFLPAENFEFRKKMVPKNYIKWAKIALVAAGGVLFLLVAFPFIRGTLRQPLDAALANHPDDVRYTLPYIFANLKDTLWLLLNTFLSNTTFYLNTLVGGKLGYFSIDIDWLYVVVMYVLLLLSLLPEKGQPQLLKKPVHRTGIILSLLCSLLVVYACLNWTPTYYTTIYGIQGRYFLPLLPLLLVCVSDRVRVAQTTKNIEKPLLVSMFAVSCFVAFNAFLIILAR